MSSERVRELHLPKWRAFPAPLKLQAYFEALGLPGDLDTSVLSDRVQTRFPDEVEAFFIALNESMMGVNVGGHYEVKNASFDLSLLIGAAFRGAVHRAILQWVAERDYAPSTVLDIGCDNGITTCFYALLWPNAKVTGIEITEDGIARAHELAQLLGLSNVSFVCQSAEEFAATGIAGSFSLVLTTTVLHEAGFFSSMEDDRLFFSDAFLPRDSANISDFYGAVARLLNPVDGRWLGAEMLQAPHLLWEWTGALEDAGLHIEQRDCARLNAGEEIASVIVAGRQPQPVATPAWAASYWLRANPPAFGPETELPCVCTGLEAQCLFDSITAKRRIAEAKLWQPGQHSDAREWERAEIWLTDSLAILYDAHANMGLTVHFARFSDLKSIREEWEGIVRRYQETGSVHQCRIDQ